MEKGYAARSAYHKWALGKMSRRTADNEKTARTVEQIHTQHPDKGYRRINDDLKHDYANLCWTAICGPLRFGFRAQHPHPAAPQPGKLNNAANAAGVIGASLKGAFYVFLLLALLRQRSHMLTEATIRHSAATERKMKFQPKVSNRKP